MTRVDSAVTAGSPVSHREPARALGAHAPSSRALDGQVRRLRKKLGGFSHVVTVEGAGPVGPAPVDVLVGSGDAG
ncbi:hypothetical protein J4G33_13685 [Actinotalea sp. BY-33]|uniref:Uncharacterized protein n=1 Tax=Actinotalea soli TaxID=2819234 RepID=A0A939RUN3_9CELL|nr:hypothetical protein [Actinotalea soli]MBO1752859.1 hypothetical protein [Actinotalea soli]